MGDGFLRAVVRASANDDVIEIWTVGATDEMVCATSWGESARSVRTGAKITSLAIGASALNIPATSLSARTAKIIVARSSPKVSRHVAPKVRAAAGLCAPS